MHAATFVALCALHGQGPVAVRLPQLAAVKPLAVVAAAAANASGGSHASALRPRARASASVARQRSTPSCDRTCRRCATLNRQLMLPTPLRTSVNATAEIVVSQCRHGLGWLEGARASIESRGLFLARTTVYTKCGRYEKLVALPVLRGAEIVQLPNVGRCDHAYAHHLARRYTSLADMVLFIKDSTFDYPLRELRSLLLTVPQVVDEAAAYGFSCFRRPHLAVSSWHLRREVFKFRIASYISADEQARLRKARAEMEAGGLTHDPAADAFSGRRERARAAESVEKAIGSKEQFTAELSVCEFVARALGDGARLQDLLAQAFVQVCYGGSFAVTADRARALERGAYRRLEMMLQRGDNIEEGHFMERLWAALLAPPMDPSIAAHFAATSGRGYAMIDGPLGVSYPGAVKQCCCQRPGHDLWRRPSPLGELGPISRGRVPFGDVVSPTSADRWRNTWGGSRHALKRGASARGRAAAAGGADPPEPAQTAVLVARSLEVGGASTYLTQLGGWLRQQGYNVLCVAPEDGAAAPALRRAGMSVAVLPQLGAARTGSAAAPGPAAERPSAWGALSADLLNRTLFAAPDVVIWASVVWADAIYGNDRARWCRRAPRFVWLVLEMELDAAHKRPSGFWYGHNLVVLRSAPLLRRTLLNADAVVFVSDAQRAVWQQHDHVHFHAIPPSAEHAASAARPLGLGSDRGAAQPTTAATDAAAAAAAAALRLQRLQGRASLGIPPGAFLISASGPLCERKRQHVVLDALERLVLRAEDAHLLLVGGEGGCADEPAAYVTELRIRAAAPPLAGRVTITPLAADGWRALALSDLHVSAARTDAYPLSALEASRLGVPTIAAAAGGAAELLHDEPELKWVLPQTDEALVGAVESASRLFAQQPHALARVARLQQAAAIRNTRRFAAGWARALERVARQSRVHEACGVWNPEAACGARIGAYGVARPPRRRRRLASTRLGPAGPRISPPPYKAR